MVRLKYVPLAQLDRASDYGSEGQGFEFSAARQNDTAFCGVVFLLFHINTYIAISLVNSFEFYIDFKFKRDYNSYDG